MDDVETAFERIEAALGSMLEADCIPVAVGGDVFRLLDDAGEVGEGAATEDDVGEGSASPDCRSRRASTAPRMCLHSPVAGQVQSAREGPRASSVTSPA